MQGSNHGAVTNGADWTGGDGGLHFNGMDERVAFAGDITSSYSIVMTIKPELVGFHLRLISERSFPTLYMNSNSHYRLALYSMNVDTQFSPVKAPSDMQNTYLVITYDQNSGVVTLYIDGVRAGAVTGDPARDRSYTGEICDFMIYDRALTDFEIERSALANKAKY